MADLGTPRMPLESAASERVRKSRNGRRIVVLAGLTVLLSSQAALAVPQWGRQACHLKSFSGQSRSDVLLGPLRSSLGQVSFPDTLPITIDYRFRSLLGEPVRKFVASVPLPKRLSIHLDRANTSLDLELVSSLPQGAASIEHNGQGIRILVTPDIMRGLKVSSAAMRISFHPSITEARFTMPYPGIFGQTGGRGWDVEGSPNWKQAFGKPTPTAVPQDWQARNRRIWCGSVGVINPLWIKLTDVFASAEDIIARLRRTSPEFNRLLSDLLAAPGERDRQGARLASALLAGVEGTPVSQRRRAEALAERAASAFGVTSEDLSPLRRANEVASHMSDLVSLTDLGEDISKQFQDSETPAPLALASQALTLRETIDAGDPRGRELKDFATRLHRLTLLGRVEPFELTMLIDQSGSMGDVFEALKDDVRDLVRDLSAISQDVRIGITAYHRDGEARLPAQALDAEGLSGTIDFVNALSAKSGDAVFATYLRVLASAQPPDRRRIVLIFGDLDDQDGSGLNAVRAMMTADPRTIVIPVWTTDEAVPQRLAGIASLSRQQVLRFGEGQSIGSVILAAVGLEEFRVAGTEE